MSTLENETPLTEMEAALDRIRIRLHGLERNETVASGLRGPVADLAMQADLLAEQIDRFTTAYQNYIEAIDRIKGVGS